jgi:hypothetical protein
VEFEEKKMKFLVAAIFFIANYHFVSSGRVFFPKARAFLSTNI